MSLPPALLLALPPRAKGPPPNSFSPFPPPFFRSSLKPSPRLFLRPCRRFYLTIHPLLDRHPRCYHPSPLKCTYMNRPIYTHAHVLTCPMASLFLPLSSSLPSRASRRTSKSSKERQSQRLSDWIVSSIYTTFDSTSFCLCLSLFLSHMFREH